MVRLLLTHHILDPGMGPLWLQTLFLLGFLLSDFQIPKTFPFLD